MQVADVICDSVKCARSLNIFSPVLFYQKKIVVLSSQKNSSSVVCVWYQGVIW